MSNHQFKKLSLASEQLNFFLQAAVDWVKKFQIQKFKAKPRRSVLLTRNWLGRSLTETRSLSLSFDLTASYLLLEFRI